MNFEIDPGWAIIMTGAAALFSTDHFFGGMALIGVLIVTIWAEERRHQ